MAFTHLRASGTSVVLDHSGDTLPRILHWGADLGDLADADLAALADTQRHQQVSNTQDDPVPLALVPEHSAGWLGTPGLEVHRDGGFVDPSFTVGRCEVLDDRVVVDARDDEAGVALAVELQLTAGGLVRQRATVTNLAGSALVVAGLVVAFPVPPQAAELLDLSGRHLRERSPQRHRFTQGTHLRENRRGRTGTDATLVMVAGEPGFGFRSGEVWGVHVAWSGNHRTLAESTSSGVRILAGGETLLAGEIRLGQGESYDGPWVYASYGVGLDALAARFHTFLRSRPQHPRTPRPVTLNTWEAVYFDQDLDRLTALADAAAEVGAERFVLDDGWFLGRRDDRAGLGDWYVDPVVWPDGLHPLVEHVRGLGLQFGLWVEPEMVNPDSDLARQHPDWLLAGSRLLSRHQLVLDLGHPDAYAHIRGRLLALLEEHPVDYLKWDHNRDLLGPAHRQTLAFYRLVDDLKAAQPGLEIESCSSGGGRVDLEVLERTDRIWASDCTDPLERQQIQRWTGLIVPPELVGSHVAAPTSHTTGRTHVLDFRAGSAFFGHLGIEWDLGTTTPEERDRLAAWVAAHVAHRDLLHTGTVVNGDHPDPSLWVHGVVAPDRSRAVYALVQTTTSQQAPAGLVRLPGLDPDATYRLAALAPVDLVDGAGQSPLPWWVDGVTLPGRVLDRVGVQAPMLYPERLVLLEATRSA